MKNTFRFLTSLFVLVSSHIVCAQNPIVSGQFTADPTARVFEGKVYVYPSHDIPSPIERLKEWFCMADYHVFSSEDLVDWTDHGVIVSQENVPWVKPDSYAMWAPDCVYRDGKYYFFFPSAPKEEFGEGFTIGVAVADKPYGPFVPEAEPIKGVKGIDPCVFIDKDNQAYLYWSGRGMFMAKLKDNMTELATEPVAVEGLPEGFKEGPFLFERKGKYYFTFPWVQDKTETLAYAIGDTPMGPFEFKGLIMEQWPSECWTNHHSIVEYQDQWYLFYHHNDYSPEFDKNRSMRIDSLFFNPDGTIRQVTPTFRGVGITNARRKINMDRYSRIADAGIRTEYLDEGDKFKGWKTVFTGDGSWIQYNSVDFGSLPVRNVKVRVQSETGGHLVVSTQSQNIMAEIPVPAGTGWNTIDVPVRNSPEGVQNLVVTLKGSNSIELDWITFTSEPSINALTDKERKEGWILLFNGTDLHGWTSVGKPTPPQKGWSIEDGVLTVNKGGRKRGGDIITENQFSEFDLSFDFKITKAANSGIKYLFTRYENGGWLGNEYQVLDDDHHPDAKAGRDGNRKTASLYDVYPTGKKQMKPTGEWNTGRVVVKGSVVTHYLNGKKVLSYDRNSNAYKEAVGLSKFNKAIPVFGTVEKGHILLQDHDDEVSFRNIKIRDLTK